jgi:drug/metabolite transporter (DMT)-like permease
MPSALARGVVLAASAAAAFGVTTPIIARYGDEVGPIMTAALLYGGAAAMAIAMLVAMRRRGPALRRADLPRLLAVAIAGGAIAPVLFAWGLQQTGGLVGSLLLNLEAVFTVALARVLYREPIGHRVGLAVAAMVAGGAALTLAASTGGGFTALGAAAIAGTTLCWAIDNALTRPLAEREPLAVVAAKASLGAAFTTIAAVVAAEPRPPLAAAAVLVACGATGYGLSLRLYLLAQRRIGAARTGSVFALAPFVGATVAVAIGERAPDVWTVAATALFATGVYLHITEKHAHVHAHAAVDHDHPHRHDDGHHFHAHEPPVIGEHSHPHHHDTLEHEHDHAPDLHHDHH